MLQSQFKDVELYCTHIKDQTLANFSFSLFIEILNDCSGDECINDKREDIICPNRFCDGCECFCNDGYINIENNCRERRALNTYKEMNDFDSNFKQGLWQ